MPTKRYLPLLLCWLVIILSTFYATYWYIYGLLPDLQIIVFNPDADFQLREFLQNGIVVVFRFTIYAYIYYLFGWQRLILIKESNARAAAFREKIKMLDTQNALYRNERILLRRQLHPHTLHNILNKLYARALRVDEQLAEDLLKLDDFLRQSLNPVLQGGDVVDIEREVHSIRRFIALHGAERGKLHIRFTVKGNPNGHFIPAMALVSLIENAVKYGVSNNPRAPIKVALTLSAGKLEFSCRNQVDPDKADEISHGTGLKNLRRRLEILFPQSHELLQTQPDGIYVIRLRILYISDLQSKDISLVRPV